MQNGVAAITGAARGIDEPIAARLARDGFCVAVADIDQDAASAAARRTRQIADGRAVGMRVDAQLACA